MGDIGSPQRFLLLLGLAFFLGLAFEGFYWKSASSRPGGIRTFPLLALAGGLLYLLEPRYASAFAVGLVVLGAWLYPYYQVEVSRVPPEGTPPDGIMVPVVNLVAYLLGPVTLGQPVWAGIGLTVVAVLLLRARERLHGLAAKVPGEEIITVGQFLVLTGIVLPVLPHEPFTSLTPLSPFQIWLAVVVVCALSYGSYLLQRYVSPTGSVLFAAILGGMYSSTATTVVLARRAKGARSRARGLSAGIVLSTAVMYLRLGVVVAIFDTALALTLAPYLIGLFLLGAVAARVLLGRTVHAPTSSSEPPLLPKNPLEIPAALIFAVLFLVLSIGTAWARTHFGSTGVYALAAVVGVVDVDPFVLSIAHRSVTGLGLPALAAAVLVAASSNDLLKAVYAGLFGGWRRMRGPFAALAVLAVLGFVFALVLA